MKAYLRRNQSKGFGAVLIPVREEQGKNLWNKHHVDTKASEEGEGGGAPSAGADPSAGYGEAAVLPQPMEDHRDAEIHL